MGYVWFSVIVSLIIVQNVSSYKQDIRSCDECIREGGSWCSKKVPDHCAFDTTDVWCSGEPEELIKRNFVATNGQALRPSYVERTIFVGNPDSLSFTYISPVERKVSLEIYNTTQNFHNIMDLETEDATCDGKRCELSIEAKVRPDFCQSSGTDVEFIFVKIKVENITEEMIIKYHVPCACECTKKTERKSAWCSSNGDWACGVCLCYDDWFGEDCSKKIECGSKRGDVPCQNPQNDLECSGNGVCGHCETCICDKDKEGSQYFDPENYCSDICMDTNGCGQCLTNNTIGECAGSTDSFSECNRPMTILAYNKTIAAERDDYDRKIWVTCKDTFVIGKDETCDVKYVAMREDGHINVMIVESCNEHHSHKIVATTDTKVPWILGVLGVVAAVAAVAGVLLWKHINSAPAMPFSSPDYQNIDAEDCVGENPLYKPPTTTFTNPQFGKC